MAAVVVSGSVMPLNWKNILGLFTTRVGAKISSTGRVDLSLLRCYQTMLFRREHYLASSGSPPQSVVE